jgi:hypothetical protein
VWLVDAGIKAASQNYASAARSVLAMWLSSRRKPISLATVLKNKRIEIGVPQAIYLAAPEILGKFPIRACSVKIWRLHISYFNKYGLSIIVYRTPGIIPYIYDPCN